MEWLKSAVQFFLKIDQHLGNFIDAYQNWTYLLLFAIIFVETGLVVMPFLPGDSLLFAAGVFAQKGALRHELLFVLLTAAAVAGDTVNYWIGKHGGTWLLASRWRRFINPEHLARTHAFFETYGGKTIIMARFVPIVRTFAPFVAGIGTMTYRRFLAYNVIGGAMWVAICLYAGYFFGGRPWVKDHFELVIIAIVFISVLPGIVEYVRYRMKRSAHRESGPAAVAEQTMASFKRPSQD